MQMIDAGALMRERGSEWRLMSLNVHSDLYLHMFQITKCDLVPCHVGSLCLVYFGSKIGGSWRRLNIVIGSFFGGDCRRLCRGYQIIASLLEDCCNRRSVL